MTIKRLLAAAILFLITSTSYTAENVTVVKQVKLDGVLSEECWTNQKSAVSFTNNKGKR